MIKSIWRGSLKDIMPSNILVDEKMTAAAEALDVELQRLAAESKLVLHLPRIDELPHEVLDHLAFHFHCDHYEPSTMALEVKRNLIRKSIYWHKIKGTPASLEEFLGYFGITAQVIENWNYGGEPYFFRLKLKDVAYLEDDGDTFMRLVYAAKNERSWLDAFIFDLSPAQDSEIYIGIIGQDTAKESIDLAALQAEEIKLEVREFGQSVEKLILDTDFTALNSSMSMTYGQFMQEREYQYIAAEFDDYEIPIYEEPDPEEPDEEELLGNFLRLYFNFPYTTKLKTILMANPKENISGSEINDLGYYSAAKKVILNRRGFSTLGIIKAEYVSRTQTKIF